MQLLTVQKEVADILKEVELGESPEDKFWIALRESTNEDHLSFGDVQVVPSTKGVLLHCDNFSVTRKNTLTIVVDPPGRLCTFPSLSIDIRLVLAVALSKSTLTLLVGTEDGSLKRFDTETRRETSKVENAHFSVITILRAFPSDKVLLSVGSDFLIKLWDIDLAEDKPARTFRHQLKTITGVALIGGGRNFVLTSKDGSTVLWECGSGLVVSTFLRIDNHNDPALCVVVESTSEALKPSDIVSANRQFECEDKVMYVGYQSGVIQEFRIASHSQTSVKFKRDQAVTALVSNGRAIVAGYRDGTIVVWDRDTQRAEHKATFNPSFAIGNMTISGQSLIFDNGPELLLTMDLETHEVGQLVGLTEAFNVQLIAAVEKAVVVATRDEIAHY